MSPETKKLLLALLADGTSPELQREAIRALRGVMVQYLPEKSRSPAPWFAIGPALRKSGAYDPIRDFTPITLVQKASSVVVVSASSPLKSLRDLIAAAKKNPGDRHDRGAARESSSSGRASAGSCRHCSSGTRSARSWASTCRR